MPKISVRDNGNNRWKRSAEKNKQINKNKQKTNKEWKEQGDGNFSEKVRVKLFKLKCELGFLQLICKHYLIFKSILELALTIRLDLELSFFIYSWILVLKWRQVSPL